MPDYVVEIGNIEESIDNVSVTGTVNGYQCACVLNKRALPEDAKERQTAIDKGLVRAFVERPKAAPHAGGRVVSL